MSASIVVKSAKMKITKEPFIFYSRLHLIELTGLSASTIPGLLEHLSTINGSSVYYHTHHFIQRHQHLSPEPPNDFAYWVSDVLGEESLGEKLASIDIMAYPTIRGIREALIRTLEEGIKGNRRIKNLCCEEGEEFNFLKSMSFIFRTSHSATTLQEFACGLKNVSISSVYFHMFESRLRLERATNDFSNWLLNSLDEKQLALKIAQLDPYTLTGEGLRAAILKLVAKKIG